MKRYKYQALITLYEAETGDPSTRLGSAPRRMVVRGRNHESQRSQVFAALVSCDEDHPFRPGSRRRLATMRLTGDEVPDYIGVGDHFDLWLGTNVGEGLVTRRLFT